MATDGEGMLRGLDLGGKALLQDRTDEVLGRMQLAERNGSPVLSRRSSGKSSSCSSPTMVSGAYLAVEGVSGGAGQVAGSER
jgi:hypothetical protein